MTRINTRFSQIQYMPTLPTNQGTGICNLNMVIRAVARNLVDPVKMSWLPLQGGFENVGAQLVI